MRQDSNTKNNLLPERHFFARRKSCVKPVAPDEDAVKPTTEERNRYCAIVKDHSECWLQFGVWVGQSGPSCSEKPQKVWKLKCWLWLSSRLWVNLSLEVSWWRSVCVCLEEGWSTLPIYSKPADMKFIRFKLLHSCDPHAEWIPSLSSWCCPGNHLNACHWRCCSVNRESEVGGNAKGWQEEVERGKCGVGNNSGRFTVNDKMRVNIWCELTIKTFSIM